MNFIVTKHLNKKAPLELYPDVSDSEMYAIGKMTVSWALLEGLIGEIVCDTAEKCNHILPKDFLETSTLTRVLKEFKCLIAKVTDDEIRKFLGDLLHKVKNLKYERERLTHGLYEWDYRSPAKLKVRTPKAGNVPKHVCDSGTIEKLARTIAQLNFELIYPRGECQFTEERARQGFSVSRAAAILLTRDETSDRSLKRP